MVKETPDEWFGFETLSEDSEPVEIEKAFLDNVRYAEFACRERGLDKKHRSLALRLAALFDELPPECQFTITDVRDAMIRDIVRARNRYAHGLYETKPFTNERLLVLSIKVAALLYCSEDLRHEGATAAIRRISQNSPYKNKMLSRSDKP